MVNIQTTRTGEAAAIQGTGFNLEPAGMIVTNRHVVEGASTVEVAFSDDKRLFSQDIDLLDGYDLAIVRLKGKGLPSLPVSDRMAEIGQSVTIIGNPRGFQGVSCRGSRNIINRSGIQTPISPSLQAAAAAGFERDKAASSASSMLPEDSHRWEEQNRAIAIPTALLHLFKDKPEN